MRNIYFDKKSPTYSVRENIINTIIPKHNFIEKINLGQSAVGRNIDAFHIGNSKSSILITAAYHGMEWQTSLVILKFMDEICEIISRKSSTGQRFKEAVNKRGITFVPCVNPDGVEISLSGFKAAGEYKDLVKKIGDTEHWQANARGVDINHNFNAGWEKLHQMEQESGIIHPARTRYGGPSPESEPETKSIVKLCKENFFEYAFAFHSQGEVIYWNYGDKTPDCSRKIAQKFADLSGYSVSEPSGLAVGGGFKDWFINEFGRPGFTIEIGKGKNPLPISDFEQIYYKLKNALYFIASI